MERKKDLIQNLKEAPKKKCLSFMFFAQSHPPTLALWTTHFLITLQGNDTAF